MNLRSDGEMGGNRIVEVDGVKVDLRHPALAAFWAWLIPGAGHFYQRRYGKASVFCLCIVTTYLLGVVIGGRGAAAPFDFGGDEGKSQVRRFAGIALSQGGIGVTATLSLVQKYATGEGKKPLWGGFLAFPSQNDLHEWNRTLASGYDIGKLYVLVANFLNILVVFDAFAGPLPVPEDPKKRKKKLATEES